MPPKAELKHTFHIKCMVPHPLGVLLLPLALMHVIHARLSPIITKLTASFPRIYDFSC